MPLTRRDGKPAPEAGRYLLEATKLLFTPEQLSEIGSMKEPGPPFAPPLPSVSPVQETRPPEIVKIDVELEAAETKYRLNRIDELKESGLSDEEADEQIKKEIEAFREPVPLGFGDVAERREGGPILGPIIAGAEAPNLSGHLQDQRKMSIF
jgi:hypothetical protein